MTNTIKVVAAAAGRYDIHLFKPEEFKFVNREKTNWLGEPTGVMESVPRGRLVVGSLCPQGFRRATGVRLREGQSVKLTIKVGDVVDHKPSKKK